MPAPHYHAPSLRLAGTASPHLCLRAFARPSPALDNRRQQSTTACIWQTDALFQNYVTPLQGSHIFALLPRALPWAGISRPFRAVINFVASFVGNFVESQRLSGWSKCAD